MPTGQAQWRNVNHVYHSAPPGLNFWRPYKVQNFYCLLKKRKKKVATIISVFLIGFLCPLKLFVHSNIFPHHRTLIWPTYGTFLQPNNFYSKFWCPLLMATPGQPRLRYAIFGQFLAQFFQITLTCSKSCFAGHFSEFGRQMFLKAQPNIPLQNLRSKFNST